METEIAKEVKEGLKILNDIVGHYNDLCSDCDGCFPEVGASTFVSLYTSKSMKQFITTMFNAAKDANGNQYGPISITRLLTMLAGHEPVVSLMECRRRIMKYDDYLHLYTFDVQLGQFVIGEPE